MLPASNAGGIQAETCVLSITKLVEACVDYITQRCTLIFLLVLIFQALSEAYSSPDSAVDVQITKHEFETGNGRAEATSDALISSCLWFSAHQLTWDHSSTPMLLESAFIL